MQRSRIQLLYLPVLCNYYLFLLSKFTIGVWILWWVYCCIVISLGIFCFWIFPPAPHCFCDCRYFGLDLTLTRSYQLQLLCQGGQEDCLQYLFHPGQFSGTVENDIRYHLYFKLFRVCERIEMLFRFHMSSWRWDRQCLLYKLKSIEEWTALSPVESPARGNALVAAEPQTRQSHRVWWSVLGASSQNKIEQFFSEP